MVNDKPCHLHHVCSSLIITDHGEETRFTNPAFLVRPTVLGPVFFLACFFFLSFSFSLYLSALLNPHHHNIAHSLSNRIAACFLFLFEQSLTQNAKQAAAVAAPSTSLGESKSTFTFPIASAEKEKCCLCFQRQNDASSSLPEQNQYKGQL